MTDILQDNDGDLLLIDGDLVIGESTVQHQRDIILLGKGDLKYAPTVGVGASRYLLDSNPRAFEAACRAELLRDGLPATLTLNNLKTLIYRG